MSLKVLDLFAGCGGFSLGFERAGYEVIASNEVDQWAADTYRFNNPRTELIQEDIRKIPDEFWARRFKGKIDVLIGGPPCQGFSVSGHRQYGMISETNSLVTDYLRVVKSIAPDFVVVENVRGFKTGSISKDKKVFDFLVEILRELGYHVYHSLLNAEDFGVPSLRSRIFIIGSKFPFRISPFLNSTHTKKNNDKLSTYIGCIDALSDLPELRAGEGFEGMQPYSSKPKNKYQCSMRQYSQGVFNHVAMKHTPRVVERFREIEPGESSYRYGKMSSEKPTIKYKMNNQRLVPGKPSLCVTANFQSTFIHPTQHRNLTAREAARLMSFPDCFIFQGKRTQMSSKFLKKHKREHEDFLSQYNQIGNAVPPILAETVARGLKRAIIEGEGQPWNDDLNTQLLMEL